MSDAGICDQNEHSFFFLELRPGVRSFFGAHAARLGPEPLLTWFDRFPGAGATRCSEPWRQSQTDYKKGETHLWKTLLASCVGPEG